MKTLFILILSLGYITATSQGIIAGDTSSPGIIFVDIPDISVEVPFFAGEERDSIDINNDGIMDIKIAARFVDAMSFDSWTTECIGLNQCQICYYPDHDNWVNRFLYNSSDSISSSSGWSIGGILKRKRDDWYFGTIYYSGVFSNGYIGFRINLDNEYIYGWLRAYASPNTATVYDYAYEVDSNGMNNICISNTFSIWPNPVQNTININISENIRNSKTTYFITDIMGRKVMEGNINSNNQLINCSELKSGNYFMRLLDGNTSYKPQKFIKY